MDYHNCKDLPLWAQILVDSAPNAEHEREAGTEFPVETVVQERDVAA